MLASWQLAQPHAKLVYALWALLSGVSLFVLTGLVHEASHYLLFRSKWANETAGNLAGWLLLTPLTAYRAFHLKHHQTTNEDDDPNVPLNSRWMLGFGSLVYVGLVHWYAWRNLRGKQLIRYLLESAGMMICLAGCVLLPRALRERAWMLPIGIVAVLQNIRIVSEHLDLGPGRYRDTWQIVLPSWLSSWLLHYDHHLEHHLRPGLRWFELPGYRAELLSREPDLRLHRLGLGAYFRDVFLMPFKALGWWREAPRDVRSGVIVEKRLRSVAGVHLRADSPGRISGSPSGPGTRSHGLDALRGLTMILVVVLHAALAYNVVSIPKLIWVVRDPDAHPVFDVLCWWTFGISSPFYLMSGFFGVDLVRTRGLRGFVTNRAKRILGPFIVAGLTILPVVFFVWVGGWLISGHCTPREIARMKFHARGYQQNLYGPAHLWSLEYLAVMLVAYATILGLARLIRRPSWLVVPRATWLLNLLASPWRPLVFALPTMLILWGGHHLYGIDAIMDRSNSFVPEPLRLLHNSIFFLVGVILHQFRDDLGRFAHRSWTYLILSVPVFACRAILIREDLQVPLPAMAEIAMAALGALFVWLISFGLLGLALGTIKRPWPSLSYLADSSYWVYLCHLPIVGLLQIDLLPVRASATLKFFVVFSVTMAVCLASYQVMVRHTFLGLWLHGPRTPQRQVTGARHSVSTPRTRHFAAN
jgi:peptidoglycan/LPS O-acetylase OafA/YrhL